MKYMLIMRSTDEANEGFADVDLAEVTNAVGRFNDELVRAGVLLAAEGLDADPSQGVVVDFTGEAPVVTDGPYDETKELFGGFYLLDVATIDDAVAWARRMPYTDGSRIGRPRPGRRARGRRSARRVPPLYVVRGELLARLGRRADARGEFLRAGAMCTNAAECTVLEAKQQPLPARSAGPTTPAAGEPVRHRGA